MKKFDTLQVVHSCENLFNDIVEDSITLDMVVEFDFSVALFLENVEVAILLKCVEYLHDVWVVETLSDLDFFSQGIGDVC